jgi:hypothetical protein
LKDESGEEVLATVDRGPLAALAEAGGGDLVELDQEGGALVRLHERRIEPESRRAAASKELDRRPNRFQWVLLPAVLMGILDLAWTERKRR